MTGAETISLENIIVRLFDHQLQISGLGTGKSVICIYNVSSQVLNKGTTTTDSYTQDNLPSGVLLIRAQKENGSTAVRKIVVK